MEQPIDKVIVMALSGGIDSATVLGRTLQEPNTKVIPIWFGYGSKHNQYERQSALALVSHYQKLVGVGKERLYDLQEISLEEFMYGFNSALLLNNQEIPEGHYEADNMKSTVVPARNLIFMSIMAGIAANHTAPGVSVGVSIGIHQGDHAIYPDCRPDFFDAATKAVSEATDGVVSAYAPFLYQTKVGIVREALKMFVPLELTRTCYKDQPDPCGKCGACVERLEAFTLNNCTDPVDYEEAPSND